MSLPSGLASVNRKLPLCRRTATGTPVAASLASAVSALVSSVIFLRNFHSAFHQAWADIGSTSSRVSKARNRFIVEADREGLVEGCSEGEADAKAAVLRQRVSQA